MKGLCSLVAKIPVSGVRQLDLSSSSVLSSLGDPGHVTSSWASGFPVSEMGLFRSLFPKSELKSQQNKGGKPKGM